MVFAEPVRVFVKLDSENSNLFILLRWYDPFMKALIKMKDYKPQLTVFLFKKCLFTKTLKRGKGRSTGGLLQSVELDHTHVKAYYALNNPFNTCVAHGIIRSLSFFLRDAQIVEEYPDFLASGDYVLIEGETDLNMGKTAIAYLKQRSKRRNKSYGTVQSG
jgi:hypothetical protein